ncbi:MAG: hypothetical protein WC309_03195 [Candidatus Paceibacterota bacterium]
MKSFNICILIITALFTGCFQKSNNTYPQSRELKMIDSLKTVIAQKDSAYNELKNDYKAWITLTFDTENHCLVFAESVKKNPKNTVFIVGWTKRTFNWAHEWKKNKKIT